jgi:hypothetical protein
VKFNHFFDRETGNIGNVTVWRRKSDDKQKKWLSRLWAIKSLIVSETGAFCEGLDPHDVVIGCHIKSGSIFAPGAICGAVPSKNATKEFAFGAYNQDSTWTGTPDISLSIGLKPVGQSLVSLGEFGGVVEEGSLTNVSLFVDWV